MSQHHKCHLTSKLNFKTVPVLPSLDPSLTFPYHLLSSSMHPTGFFFCFFPGFFAIFILLPSNNNNRIHTQKNRLLILAESTGKRLYLPFSVRFGTKRNSDWFQINRKIVNTIWLLPNLTILRKYFSVCTHRGACMQIIVVVMTRQKWQGRNRRIIR